MCRVRSYRVTSTCTDHEQNKHLMPFTYRLQFWIMTGIFIAGTAPSFSIKRCANPASNWALFIKRSSTNTLWTPLLPEKQNASHCSRNAGFFWEAEQGYISLTTKNTSLERFFPSESCAVLPDEARWWARSCSRSGVRFSKLSLANYVVISIELNGNDRTCDPSCFWENAPLIDARTDAFFRRRNAHIRSSTLIYISKSHDWKKTFQNLYEPGRKILAQKYSVILQIVFFETWHA